MKISTTINRFLCGMTALLAFMSCDGKAGLETDSAVFTLQEARSIFERMVEDAVSKSGTCESGKMRSRLSPGEYAPIWEDAESLKEGTCVGYIVPIETEYRIYSYTGKYGEKVDRPWRRVRQELSVMKDLSTGIVDILSDCGIRLQQVID